jgi:TP53 regulating kinase-like protein
VIVKRRLTKKYRIPEIDIRIRSQRTKRESKIIHRAKKAGVPTPIIFAVDPIKMEITMEFVKGEQVKKVLRDLNPKDRLNLFQKIGRLIGRLHKNGIIHGDLTTSNIMLTDDNDIVFIDFGLSGTGSDLEDRGVDLHLLRRALLSKHNKYAEICFKATIEGYEKVMGKKSTAEVLNKIREIERRGRYIAER